MNHPSISSVVGQPSEKEPDTSLLSLLHVDAAALEQLAQKSDYPVSNALDVSEILPEDFSGPCHVRLLEGRSFQPDQWSQAFLNGLSLVDFDGEDVLELGIGTAINLIYLAHAKAPRRLIGSDLHPDVVHLAAFNLRNALGDEHFDRVIRLFVGNLASGVVEQSIDTVVGCLPQVIAPPHVKDRISSGENSAHYYDPEQFASDLNSFGLGLNEAVLLQARDFLKRGGRVILNLSGRPGKKRLEHLFERNGFRPKLLHSEIIAQHTETSLSSLAALEAALESPFEFFSDAQAQCPISATEAEERRLVGESVFHFIYVFQGTL